MCAMVACQLQLVAPYLPRSPPLQSALKHSAWRFQTNANVHIYFFSSSQTNHLSTIYTNRIYTMAQTHRSEKAMMDKYKKIAVTATVREAS